MSKRQLLLSCSARPVSRPRTSTSALRRVSAGIAVAVLAVLGGLPATAQAGTNGQHIYINGYQQRSVLVCGTNQRAEQICETFNTSSYGTADPNGWWWVGTVTIKGWTQPNERGSYLGQVSCFVPKSQDGGDWVTCNTGW